MSNESTKEVSPSVWFIHGANATPLSFAYLQMSLRKENVLENVEFVNVTYDCQEPISSTIEIIAKSLPEDKPIFLVGHSLGGVLAVAVAQRVKHFELGKNIKGVITLSAPVGGSEGADYLQWLFPHYYLFKNISTKNRIISDIKSVGAVVPTLSFITTSGNNPVYPEANDGVVTVTSQRALRGSKKLEVPYNHFEVLLSDNVATHIKNVIFNTSQFFEGEFNVSEGKLGDY
jgi:triacylglycerol esterase/lipase EstA (alpha/beta hydrolase family)